MMLSAAIRESYPAIQVSWKQGRRTRLETLAEEGEVEWERVCEEGEIVIGEGDGIGDERWWTMGKGAGLVG